MISKEKKYFLKHFHHFALRLIERYDIYITFEDYTHLSGLYLKKPKLKKDSNGKITCKEGFLIIQNKKVRVLKAVSMNVKPLLTALPEKNTYRKKK